MNAIQPRRPDSLTRSHRRIFSAVLGLGLAGLAWLFAGCIPIAVHPLYRAADVIQDAALLGSWKEKEADGKDHWTFTAGDGKSYRIELVSDNQKAVFTGHLFKLGNERFLDLCPVQSELDDKLKENPYSLWLIPGHLFFRVGATEPTLRLSNMGLDWLKEQLKRDPKAVEHIIYSEDRVVLTAGTDALQAFIKQHLNDTDAWNNMYDDGLVRVAASPK